MTRRSRPLALFVALMIGACTTTSPEDPFDREVMLAELGENVFVPTYEDFAVAAADLRASASAYCATPDADSLTALQAAPAAWTPRRRLARRGERHHAAP